MNESDVSSTASNSTTAAFNSSQNSSLQQSILKTLKSRIFLGRYIERRLVNESVGYRDLVLLSPAEEELQRDLLDVRQCLVNHYPRVHWIGITDTELVPEYKPGICLWTEIDDKPFGPFWFQIRSVQYRSNEVIVILKCLRHITDRFIELEPLLVQSGHTSTSNSVNNASESIRENYKEIIGQIASSLTLKNVKDGFFFIIALFIALITGSFAFVTYLGTFILSLVRELSLLMHNSTPLFLGFLDFLSKIVGGFYILVAMIFRQTSPPPKTGRHIQYVGGHRFERDSYKDNQHYSNQNFD